MKQLLGVAMCGGESRRMGTDKGLIRREGITWAQIALTQLKELQIPVVISINPTQQINYRQLFNTDTLVVDSLNLQGPLNGILSLHQLNPETDLLILACDMIDMKLAVLQSLVQCYRLEPGFDFYAYHNGRFFEPLCAIYTSKALQAANLAFNGEALPNFSLQNILQNGNTKRLPVNDSESFNNNNRGGPPAP